MQEPEGLLQIGMGERFEKEKSSLLRRWQGGTSGFGVIGLPVGTTSAGPVLTAGRVSDDAFGGQLIDFLVCQSDLG